MTYFDHDELFVGLDVTVLKEQEAECIIWCLTKIARRYFFFFRCVCAYVCVYNLPVPTTWVFWMRKVNHILLCGKHNACTNSYWISDDTFPVSVDSNMILY